MKHLILSLSFAQGSRDIKYLSYLLGVAQELAAEYRMQGKRDCCMRSERCHSLAWRNTSSSSRWMMFTNWTALQPPDMHHHNPSKCIFVSSVKHNPSDRNPETIYSLPKLRWWHQGETVHALPETSPKRNTIKAYYMLLLKRIYPQGIFGHQAYYVLHDTAI